MSDARVTLTDLDDGISAESVGVTVTLFSGDRGPQGPAGATGAAGATGPQGPAGADGAAGATGATGPAGSAGATGSAGPKGDTGDTGPAGPTGATGAAGPTGAAGAAGSTGAAGATGAAGTNGATWRDGAGAPSNALGVNGDYYLNDTTSDVYLRTAGVYAVVANIKGATGAAGATGSTGAAGATGATGPTGATGTAGAAGTNGTDGKTVRNGSGAPSAGLGVDGDFYIDTTAHAIYGPKASGAWGSSTSLVGPTGATGSTGSTGATGATGPTGPAGPSTGAAGGDLTGSYPNPTLALDRQLKATAVPAYLGCGVVTGCTVGQHATNATFAFRDVATHVDTSVTAGSITIPATVQTGDVMYINVVTGSSFSHTTPTGWTIVGAAVTGTGSNPVKQSVFQRTAIAGDASTSVTLTVTGGSATVLSSLVAYAGGDGTVVVTAATGSGASGTTSTAPSVTTTVNNSRVLEFRGTIGDSSGATITNPATSRASFNNGGFFAAAVSEQTKATAGATGTQAATQTLGSWAAQTVGLAPLPAAAANMSVDVAAGTALTGTGAVVTVNATNGVTLTTADATNPRYDIVSVNSVGAIVVTAGTPAATPGWPAIPASSAPLAVVHVAATQTVILNADCTDIRVLLAPLPQLRTELVNTVAASSTAQTVPDVTVDTISYITLTGNCTFTFPAAAAGKKFRVALKQDATGSRTATWPGTVKWPAATAPTLTTTAAKTDVLEFTCYDGTNWMGQTLALNYA